MQQNRQMDEGSTMLQRIVTLLFSLANLAEQASHRSPAVRRLVLWVLYLAEAVARRMVLEAYGPIEVAEPRTVFSDGGPDDALRLAACLRILATMLAALETEWFEDGWVGWSCFEQVAPVRAAQIRNGRADAFPPARPRIYADTS